MKEAVRISGDPAVTYGLQLPGEGLANTLVSSLLLISVTTALAVSLYYSVQVLSWLLWPVIVLAILWLLGVLQSVISGWKNHVKQLDTATSTIRGASQGSIEIIGRVKAIEGQALLSPMYQIPCVHYQVSVGRAEIKGIFINNAFFQERASRALLINDGTGEVFTPSFANTFNDQLLRRIEGAKLPPHLREHIRSVPEFQSISLPRGMCNLSESLMPVGVMVQANAILLTLKASDSYIRAWARLGNDLEIMLSASQRDQIESEWRTYADTCVAHANANNKPAPLLNVLVPANGRTSFTLTYRPRTRKRFWMSTEGFQLVMSIAPVILILVLFGWISPEDLWPLGRD